MSQTARIVGRYELVSELGRGGMAVVHLALQPELDRFVALKEMAAFHASDPAFARRFLREARLAGSLSHPNVVTVFDYFEDGGTPYIAMEYVERGSLRPYIGHMTMQQIGGVLEGILAGLEQGERRGIVHRDLKPENVMVSDDGRVKIADFGIAKATSSVHGGDYRTATGMTVGTPGYMAPEQAMATDVGPRTDLYSVGCMAYELALGRIPFADTESPMALLLRHINEPVPPVTASDPRIAPEFARWIDQLLEKDPAGRPGSAAEAWDELEMYLIDVFGARWRRSAALDAPPTGKPAMPAAGSRSAILPVPGPYTPPPPDLEPAPAATAPWAGALPPPAAAAPELTASAPRPASPARRRWPAIAVGAGVIGVAAVAAFVLLPGDEQPTTPAAATSGAAASLGFAAGSLNARLPAGWEVTDEPFQVAGLKLRDAGSAAPGGDADQGVVVVGTSAAETEPLLPTVFLDSLGLRRGAVPSRDVVELGDLQAYRYPDLRPPKLGRTLTLYAAPTSAGVATLACVAPERGAGDFDAACETVASSLAAAGAKPFAIGPQKEFGTAVDRAVTRLNRARRGRARTVRDIARAERRVAAAYAGAARALDRLKISPQDGASRDDLVAALGTAGDRYRDAAARAAAADRTGYPTAVKRVASAEAAASATLERIADSGYDKLIDARLRKASLPSLPAPPKPKPTPVPTAAPRPTAVPTPAPSRTPWGTGKGPGKCVPPRCIIG